MPRRRSFSTKDRARLFTLRGGKCYLCGHKIDNTSEAYEIEHEIPWEISRDDSDDNLQLAHKSCHKDKTAVDRKVIAHVHRVEAKFTGAKRPAGKLRGPVFAKPQKRAWLSSKPPLPFRALYADALTQRGQLDRPAPYPEELD